MEKESENVAYIVWFLANTLWFGFFFVAILHYNWTPMSLIVPLLFHWTLDNKEIS